MAAADPTGDDRKFVHLDASTVRSLIPLSALIPHFAASLPSLSPAVRSPHRQSFPISSSSSLLLMPAWSSHPSLPYIGVKLVTSFPSNSALRLPSVHASYLLFHSLTGAPLASLDATHLTLLRTAAVSALAARSLARPDSCVLVLAGAGNLAPHLIAAHRFVRPTLRRVIVWNRSPDRARDLVARLRNEYGNHHDAVVFEHAEVLDEVVGLGDIVSCATGSETPIVRGERLKPGAHLDLVGSFTPSMRECDDEAIRRGRVFVDFEAAVEESGELVGAFERGVISRSDVAGTLVDLVAGAKVGRVDPDEITVFKSVGTAVVDILAAQLAYETFLRVMTSEQPESSRRGGAGKANWTARQHALWVEIVHGLVLKGHRPGTTLDKHGYNELMKEFTERTGVEYTETQFKNHWDSYKKDWGVWKKLLENTGLGWDTDKRTVIAEDEWWKNWLEQDKNAKYARWRESGLEFQDELDVIFGGSMATGDVARSSAQPSSARSRAQVETQDDHDVIPETQSPFDESPDTPEARARATFPEPANSRRRKRTSTFDLGDHINRLVEVLDTRNDSSGVTSGADSASVANCMKVLDRMPEVVQGSQLYWFATDLLLVKKTMREMFVAFATDELRYNWLIHKQMTQGSGQ